MDCKINKTTSSKRVSWSLRRIKLAVTTLLFLFISTQLWAQSGSGPSQGKNGGKPTSKPICDISVLSPVLWENGNAGPGDAHLLEGYHLPYRYIMTGLTTGTTYTLNIGFDAKDNGKFALDYVGYYRNYAPHEVFTTSPDPDCANHSAALADGEKVEPWNGTALNGTVFADGTIPEPTYLPLSVRTGTGTWAQSSPQQRKFTVFGASSVTVIGYFMDDGTATGLPLQNLTNATTGAVRMGLKVRFVAAGSTAVAAWGGHIASRFDYGNTATGASDISGSPYHTRLIKFANANETATFAGGSADRSLKASAVFIPPVCSLTGPTRACPETTSLTYNATTDAADFGAVAYSWELLNNTANAALSGSASGNTSSNSLSINVVPASAAGFTPGGSFNLHLRVTRAGLADDCYINSHTAPGDAVTIDDVRVTASATPTNIDIFAANPNSALSAEARLFPAAVDNSLFNFAWTVDAPYTIVGGNVQLAAAPNTVVGTISSTTSASPTFTPNINAFPGTFVFRVTATEKAAPFCSNSASVSVTVGGALSCPTISGDITVCASTSHTYSYSGGSIPTGATVEWLVNGGANIPGSNSGTSVSVDAGTQNFTVTLKITPANTALAPLECPYPVTVNPIPSCTIAGDAAVCAGSTGNTYTSTVLPAGGAVVHSWSITGDATIVGPTNGASVSVSANAGTTDGSFTLTDNITREGCASSCTKTVTVNATPSCSIAGDAAVCAGSTGNTYTSTVLPIGGTVVHSWSITGDATIVGPTDGASVTVSANAGSTDGSFTLTDNITRNGCASSCTKTVTVNGTPSCTIAGDAAVCAGSTGNTYTSTVLPAGGTVVHSWSITGNATISGPTDGASVSVSANAGSSDGSFTLTDNITRNGCASSCTKTVTVNATPSCTITGNDNVCEGSTNTYTSTVLPAGGTVVHSWSITGNGTIQGATNGATVSVLAGSSGTYTLTDNITRNGCTSSCSQTFTVVQCVFPHLFPTQTNCCNYANGSIENFQLPRSCITLNAPRTKISNAIPGVFFYYGEFTATASGAVTIKVDQSRNTSALGPFAPVGTSSGNANVLLDGCQGIPGTLSVSLGNGQNSGDVSFSFNAVSGQSYIVLVKYDMKSIVNTNVPAAPAVQTDPWAIYSFSMTVKYGNDAPSLVSGSLGQLPLHEKVLSGGQVVSCFDNAGVPNGSCPAPSSVNVPSLPSATAIRELQVAAYPNPYLGNVSFKIASPLSGQASLEVFDMIGRKLAVVYQGSLDAGMIKTVDFKVPATLRVPMIYKLQVGDKISYGKLLPAALY